MLRNLKPYSALLQNVKRKFKRMNRAVTVSYSPMIYDTCGSTQNSIRHQTEFLQELSHYTLYDATLCTVTLRGAVQNHSFM